MCYSLQNLSSLCGSVHRGHSGSVLFPKTRCLRQPDNCLEKEAGKTLNLVKALGFYSATLLCVVPPSLKLDVFMSIARMYILAALNNHKSNYLASMTQQARKSNQYYYKVNTKYYGLSATLAMF